MGPKRFAIAAVGGVLTACSLFVDTGGLSGVSPPPDAGPPNSGGSSPDGGIPDSAPFDAAAPDARFCAQHAGALLCEDFDGPPLDPNTVLTQNGSALAGPVAGAPSPPNALVSQVGALTANVSGHAYFLSPPLDLTHKWHASFDVAVAAGSHVIVFQLGQYSAAAGYQSELIGDPSFVLYQEFSQYPDGGGAAPFGWAPPLTLGPAWHHVDVCFDFVQSSRIAVVDGHKMTGKGISAWTGSAPIQFGVAYALGPTTDQQVYVDDVLVDLSDCP